MYLFTVLISNNGSFSCSSISPKNDSILKKTLTDEQDQITQTPDIIYQVYVKGDRNHAFMRLIIKEI